MRYKENTSEVRFGRGNDESEHDEATSSRLELTNAEYRKEGGVQKRAGWVAVTTTNVADFSRGLLATSTAFAHVGKYRLLPGRFDGTLATRTDTVARQFNWHTNLRNAGTFGGGRPAAGTAATDALSTVDGAALEISGHRYVCILGSIGGLQGRFVVLDSVTKNVLAAAALETGATDPRVVAVSVGADRRFNVYYRTSAAIKVTQVTLSTATPTMVTSTIASGITFAAGVGNFDVWSNPVTDRVTICHMDATNFVLRAVKGDHTSIVAATNQAHGGGVHVISVAERHDSTTWIADGRVATTAKMYGFTNVGFSLVTNVTITGSTGTYTAIGIGSSAGFASGGQLIVGYDNTGNQTFYWTNGDSGGNSAATALTKIMPLSKPFVEWGGTIPEPVFAFACTRPNTAAAGFDCTTVPATAFVARVQTTGLSAALDTLPAGTEFTHPFLEPIATLIADGCRRDPPTVGSSLASVTPLQFTNVYGETVFDWLLPVLSQVEATEFNATMFELQHASADPLPRVALGSIAATGGALLRGYDGTELGELSVFSPPPGLTVTPGGVGTNNGSYSFIWVLVCELSDGRVIRSTPSIQTTVTATNNLNFAVTGTVNIPTMRAPGDTLQAAWRLETYSTEVNGSVFNLRSTNAVGVGDTAVSFTNADTDDTVSGRKLLYTTVELGDEPCPPAKALCLHKNRVFGLSAADPFTLFYSKEITDGFVPGFNSTLSLRVESGDEPVGLASMDDKLLLFTGKDIYAVLGEGPNRLGTGSTYNAPERVVRGVGATSPYGIVELPFGVMFHSESGMKVLDRSLQITDISGAQLATLGDTPPLTAVHVSALQQVWWLPGYAGPLGKADNKSLTVFDYSRGKGRWLKHSYSPTPTFGWLDITPAPRFRGVGNQALKADGTVLLLGHVTAGGTLLRRDNTVLTDESATQVSMTVMVRRWRAGDWLDEVRVRRIHLLGSVLSGANTVRMNITNQRQPRNKSAPAAESMLFSAAELNDSNFAHVECRIKYQKITAADFEFVVSGDANGDLVLHGFLVDYATPSRPGSPRRVSDPSA